MAEVEKDGLSGHDNACRDDDRMVDFWNFQRDRKTFPLRDLAKKWNVSRGRARQVIYKIERKLSKAGRNSHG